MKKRLLKMMQNMANYKTQFDQLKSNSTFKAVAFILVIVFFAYLFISQSLTVVQLRYEMGEMQEEIKNLETDKKLLAEKVEQKTTDQYIEESARKKLNMVKSSEKPVQINELENKDVVVAEEKIESKDKMSIYMTDWYAYVDQMIQDIKKN